MGKLLVAWIYFKYYTTLIGADTMKWHILIFINKPIQTSNIMCTKYVDHWSCIKLLHLFLLLVSAFISFLGRVLFCGVHQRHGFNFCPFWFGFGFPFILPLKLYPFCFFIYLWASLRNKCQTNNNANKCIIF